jgi:hypothetical protein
VENPRHGLLSRDLDHERFQRSTAMLKVCDLQMVLVGLCDSVETSTSALFKGSSGQRTNMSRFRSQKSVFTTAGAVEFAARVVLLYSTSDLGVFGI